MRNKPKFICMCGHEEALHNFDPDSMFFGCTHKFFFSKDLKAELLENYRVCQCYEFKPDPLKYVEDAYVKQSKRH